MDIAKLNLTPPEQRTLESTGFATVEQIALCYGEELGLGRKKVTLSPPELGTSWLRRRSRLLTAAMILLPWF